LSCLVSASKHSQKVLGNNEGPPSFIESSIFAKHLDINSMPDPVTLPPTFQPRDVDDWEYASVNTYAHLDYTECTNLENSGTFDIGIVGHPFDLGVSYRPGARFGPNGARQGARRISPGAGWE
jgi:agmatinase